MSGINGVGQNSPVQKIVSNPIQIDPDRRAGPDGRNRQGRVVRDVAPAQGPDLVLAVFVDVGDGEVVVALAGSVGSCTAASALIAIVSSLFSAGASKHGISSAAVQRVASPSGQSRRRRRISSFS